LIVVLGKYMGTFRDSPLLIDFYTRFHEMVRCSEIDIHKKLGLMPPPNDVVIRIKLVDKYGIPMVSPTGFTSTPSRKRKNIGLSAPAVANDFWGLTSTGKVLTHELTHAYFMYYGGDDYAVKPLWMKEGIALWTADQTYDLDFARVPVEIRNSRWADYLSYLTRFEDALKRNDGRIGPLVRFLIS
jgi:hypothetical protein